MLGNRIDGNIVIKLLEKRHAHAFYEFVEKGRSGFEKWIPFVSKTHSVEEAETKINHYLEMHRQGLGYFYGLWDSKRLMGLVLIKEIDHQAMTAEIGYMIDADYQGQGIVKKSCMSMIDFLFNELGMQKIIICCDDRNERSIHLAERLGFTLEGNLKRHIKINGELCNTLFYALFNEDYPKNEGVVLQPTNDAR